jgi:hypothetical protein
MTLTKENIIEIAKEELDYMLSKWHSGLYNPDTDKIVFKHDKDNGRSIAKLYCWHPIKKEYECVKVSKYENDIFNESIHKIILVYRLFGYVVPDIYLHYGKEGY